jgi:hypothetical protein
MTAIRPKRWTDFMARQCSWFDEDGQKITLYPRVGQLPPDYDRPSNVATEPKYTKNFFRLSDRSNWGVEAFADLKDKRSTGLVPNNPLKLKFEGRSSMEWGPFGKKLAPLTRANIGVWGFDTFWNGIGRFDSAALHMEIKRLLDIQEMHVTVSDTVPLVPFK